MVALGAELGNCVGQAGPWWLLRLGRASLGCGLPAQHSAYQRRIRLLMTLCWAREAQPNLRYLIYIQQSHEPCYSKF